MTLPLMHYFYIISLSKHLFLYLVYLLNNSKIDLIIMFDEMEVKTSRIHYLIFPRNRISGYDIWTSKRVEKDGTIGKEIEISVFYQGSHLSICRSFIRTLLIPVPGKWLERRKRRHETLFSSLLSRSPCAF